MCKILLNSVQVGGCYCAMLRGLTFYRHTVVWYWPCVADLVVYTYMLSGLRDEFTRRSMVYFILPYLLVVLKGLIQNRAGSLCL